MNNIISIGPMIKIHTKTQAMIWIVLSRLSFYWSKNGKSPPTEKEILSDPETMAFAQDLCRLCFNLLKTDQILVTAVVDVKVDEDKSQVLLIFEQFDIILPKLRLTNFEIAVFQEKSPFANDVGNFVECSFFDTPLIEFLSSIHLHTSGEEVNAISKTKLVKMLPFLCGISSLDKEKEQKIIRKFILEVGSDPLHQDPGFYLRFLQELLLESPLPFLHCIYEARMKKILVRPPSNEKQIYIVEIKMANHDIVALAHYLENFEKSRVDLGAIIIKNCGLNDESLAVLGNKVSTLHILFFVQNHFTSNL